MALQETRLSKALAGGVRFCKWCGTWKWFEALFLGGFVTSLTLHEYALAILFLILCALSGLSKVTLANSPAPILKALGSFVIVALFGYLTFVTTQEKGEREWSWLASPIRGLILPEKFLSWPAAPPSYPPDYRKLEPPLTTGSIPTGQEKKPSAILRPKPEKKPTIIETAPAYGNLRERAIGLSRQIMADLYMHGWPPPLGVQTSPMEPMPTSRKEWELWDHFRSGTFRWQSLKKVESIRDEFAQLHIQNYDLDEFLQVQKEIDAANAECGSNFTKCPSVQPMQIQEVAKDLSQLANEVPAGVKQP